MSDKELEQFFECSDQKDEKKSKTLKPLTIWLPEDKKIIFDNMQKNTHREFGRKLRDLVVKAIVVVGKSDNKTS